VEREGNHPADVMTVRQLADQLGVPPRRIRYYVQQNLLPPPIGRGRASYYTSEHYRRLQQILTLREVNLSLDEIRDRLEETSITRSEPAPAVPVARAWRRWEVVPGVELHAREDLDQHKMATVDVMVTALRQVLERGDPLDESALEQDE
jgi:DNA-binding transcriptional MerR regulator